MLGRTLVTVSVWLSCAPVGVFSSSWPATDTVLSTVPTLSTFAVVKENVKDWPWFSTMALPPLAAMAATVRSPSTSSTTLVIVTGSVLAGLVLVIVKLKVAVVPSAIVAGAVLLAVILGATSVTIGV